MGRIPSERGPMRRGGRTRREDPFDPFPVTRKGVKCLLPSLEKKDQEKKRKRIKLDDHCS